MGDGTRQNPYTREDVLEAIEKNGGTAKGLDLSGKTFEAGIDLRGFDLTGIILKRARFAVRFIRGTDITEADIGAQLQNTKLMEAQLQRASLRFASLQRADLSNANLREANLSFAHLEQAILRSVNLDGADLTEAKLRLAYLEGAKWSFATELHKVDWGQDYMVGQEAVGEFETAERIYRSLQKWHEEHGIRDLTSRFAFNKQRARKKAIGAEVKRAFKEAFKWRG